MVDNINVMVKIFGSEENKEMLDSTELKSAGMHSNKEYFILISYWTSKGKYAF